MCVSSYFYLLLVRCRCTCMLLPCLTSTSSTTHYHTHIIPHIVANPSRRPAACFCPSTTYELLRHDLFTTIQGQFIRFDHIFVHPPQKYSAFAFCTQSYRRLISACLQLFSRRTTARRLFTRAQAYDINDRHSESPRARVSPDSSHITTCLRYCFV